MKASPRPACLKSNCWIPSGTSTRTCPRASAGPGRWCRSTNPARQRRLLLPSSSGGRRGQAPTRRCPAPSPLSHPLISDGLSSASPPLAWKRAGRVAHRPCGRTLSAGSPVRGRLRAERGCKWRRGQMLLLRCLRPNDRSSAVAGPPPAVRDQQRVRKQSRC